VREIVHVHDGVHVHVGICTVDVDVAVDVDVCRLITSRPSVKWAAASFQVATASMSLT
jgi:hypothetical protein